MLSRMRFIYTINCGEQMFIHYIMIILMTK